MSTITPGQNGFIPLVSLGSDHAQGSGYGVMLAPESFGTYLIPLQGWAYLTVEGNYFLTSRGGTVALEGVTADLPALTGTAFSGAQGVMTLPVSALVASGSVTIVGRTDVMLPALTLEASGLTGGLASAELQIAGTYTVTANTGAQAVVALASHGYLLDSAGTTGGVATAYLSTKGMYTVVAQVSADNVARVDVVLPALTTVPSGQAWLTLPSLTMHASGGEVVAVTYEAYAINLTTGAVSHYTNYPFDNILRFGSSYYGISATGIYLIGGDLDLTVPIDAHIKTFATKLGTQNQKRVPYVYSSGRSDGGVVVGVTADEGVTYEYESDWGEIAGSTNHRTTVGKGVKGVYYSFDVKNVNGGSLELDEISVHVAPTQRAI